MRSHILVAAMANPAPAPPARTRDQLTELPVETVHDCLLHPDAEVTAAPRLAARLALRPPYDTRRCTRCGLHWLSPRPTADGYDALYSYDVYFEGPETVESYARVAALRRWSFHRRLIRLEGHLDRGRLRILDVGAATGEFVVAALRRGHRAVGLEPSAGARREARRRHGVEMLAGAHDLDPGERFDVVHLNHVLEHLPDPLETLRRLGRQLAPGGSLLVEVPQQLGNDVDRLKALLGRDERRFDAYSLHHTYFFTAATLAETVRRADLEVIAQRTFHWGLTPPRPFSPRNLLLGSFLWLSDRLHGGGPVLEVHARRSA